MRVLVLISTRQARQAGEDRRAEQRGRLPGAWREAPRFAFFRHHGIYRSDGGWAVRQGSPLRGCALSSPWEGKRSAVSLESLGSVEGEFRSPQRARDGKQRPLGGYRK